MANIAAVGGGGVEFVPFYFYGLPTGGNPPTNWTEFGFGTPAFKSLLQSALEEAKKQRLLLDVGQGASQGQGMPSNPGSPGLAVELAYGTAQVHGGDLFSGMLPPPAAYNFVPGFMHEPEKFGKPELKAVLAGAVDEVSEAIVGGRAVSQIALNEVSILDLTPQASNGRLNWTAPAGNTTWRLIAVYEQYTNQRSCSAALGATDIIANGSWIVDHFSADGAKKITDFWDTMLLDTDEMKQLVSDVVNYFWEDSMEMQAALYWTPSMMQRFSRDRGYDLTRYLPLLFDISNQWNKLAPPYNETWVYGTNGSSVKAAVMADYRATLTEGNQEYLRHFVNWSHTLGVQYSSQAGYNIPVDTSAVIPILDAPEAESLGFTTPDAMRKFTGPVLSADKSVISNEVGAVLGASYTQTVPELLRLFKTSFVAGISMQVIHGYGYTGEYTQTTWPGFNAFGYTYTEMWNNNTPAWIHFREAMDYAARHMLILQRGVPQVDIAGYYYPAPFEALVPELPTQILNDLGFSYDYLGPENLSLSLEVTDRILAPSRASYRALVFANTTAISGDTVNAIMDYAEKSLPVFFVGGVPSACRGVNACPDGQPAELLQALVRDHTNVQVVQTGKELPVALRSAGVVPRASFASAPDNWYTTWRRANDSSEDYVLIFNAGQAAATHRTTFDVDPTIAPSVLDAWTGKRSAVLEYEQTEKGIVIPVSLKANQSRIYVFSKQPKGADPAVHVTSSSGSLEGLAVSKDAAREARVSGPANLTLSDGRRVNFDGQAIPAQGINAWNLTVTSYVPKSNESTAVAFKYIQRSVPKLKPWTEIEGLESISGVGEYTTTFNFPYELDKFGAFLSLGSVKDTLRAWVNGQQLPPIDVTDSRVDITDFVRQGQNTLRVNVTSTLFNAAKARTGTILLSGIPVGLVNPFYDSAPLAEFGLIGPVILQPVNRIPLNETA